MRLSALLAATLVVGCASEPMSDAKSTDWPAIALDPNAAKAPQKLSSTGLARLVGGKLEHHPDLVDYELTMPLFSDYALKRRAFWLPKGGKLTWRTDKPLGFPVGSILVKSFLFAPDLREPENAVFAVETRVLVHAETGWKAWPYVWDEAGGDATLRLSGTVREIDFIDPDGADRKVPYLVPQRNQCVDCHDQLEAGKAVTTIIGPRARFLQRDNVYDGKTVNQLQHFKDLGVLDAAAPTEALEPAASFADVRATGVEKLTGAPLVRAARDYLHMNCAHCHSARGVEGETSQLYLNRDNDDAFLLGVCKAPSSAGKGGLGRKYDIVAGKPDESILMYRLETTELGAIMPDIGRSLPHTTGIALVRKWIQEMAPVDCQR